MKYGVLIFAFLVLLRSAVASEEDFDSGMPFGPIEDRHIEALARFSNGLGMDVVRDMERAYDKDEDALAAVFRFSLKFDRLDDNARAYGQMLYSALLNLGEWWGVDTFVGVLSRQEAAVQQRVRDFLFYPATQAPKKIRRNVQREIRDSYPKLFPRGYVFGRKNPIFEKKG